VTARFCWSIKAANRRFFDPVEGVYLHELIEEEMMGPAGDPMKVEAQTCLDLDAATARLQGRPDAAA
jgi:hypothetical protein